MNRGMGNKGNERMGKIRSAMGLIVMLVVLFAACGTANAYSSYLTSFTTTYPGTSTSALNGCVLCHINPGGGGTRNGYGNAYLNNGHNFKTIESLDSDGDGYTNIVEINARTFPGDATSHPAAATCTSFTYSAWGACQSNNTQTRTVTSSSPSGCTGGTPVTSQTCTYTPPATGSGMPMPTGPEVFPYDPLATPAPSSDPSQAMPMGLGSVATGGNTLTLHITASFESPVNIFVTMYTPSTSGFTPYNIKTLGGGGVFRPAMTGDGGMQLRKWKTGVTSVDQTIINNVPLSQLKRGLYYVVMTAKPASGGRNYYQWVTYFIVP